MVRMIDNTKHAITQSFSHIHVHVHSYLIQFRNMLCPFIVDKFYEV